LINSQHTFNASATALWLLRRCKHALLIYQFDLLHTRCTTL
jgi:hypothetical protein